MIAASSVTQEPLSDGETCGLVPPANPGQILDLHLNKMEPLHALHLPLHVPVVNLPCWAKRFAMSIKAPVVENQQRPAQLHPWKDDEFIPVKLAEEKEASVEETVMDMLTHIRSRVESGVETAKEDPKDNYSFSVDESKEGDAAPQKLSESNAKPVTLGNNTIGNLRENSSRKRKRFHGDCESSRSRSSNCEVTCDKSSSCIQMYSDQIKLAGVTDGLNQMLEKEIETDCEIKVGHTIFKCHSAVLKRTQNSFRYLLIKEDGQHKAYYLKLKNTEPHSIKIILRYLYTAKIDLKSIEEARNVYNAAQTLKLSELYKVCTRFIAMQLNGEEDDFWPMLDSLLKDQSEPYHLLVKSFNRLLYYENFLDVSLNTLKFLVHQPYFTSCTEMTLIGAVENWARRRLKSSRSAVDYYSMRDILGPVVSKLRFLSLEQSQLLHLFKTTLLLNDKEKFEILAWCIAKREKPKLTGNLSMHKYSRDIKSAIEFLVPKIGHPNTLTVKSPTQNCSFFFAPTKDIYFLSFEFYSQLQSNEKSNSKSYTEKFTAQLIRGEENKLEVLREMSADRHEHYGSRIKVTFDVPVLLRKSPGVYYAIKLSLQSSGCYRVRENNYLKIYTFQRFFLEPLKSNFCWGNDGIFFLLNFKVL